MRVKVLGSAAGGGFPQWNCGCPNCRRFRLGTLRAPARSQAQLAVSADDRHWFLLGASPDLRYQIEAFPELHPRRAGRNSPISGIVLTSADLDHALGLPLLREWQPLTIYSTPAVRRVLLEHNTIFRLLERMPGQIVWTAIASPQPFLLTTPEGVNSEISARLLPLDGNLPAYAPHPGISDGAVSALILQSPSDARLAYLPGLPNVTDALLRELDACATILIDGTFWTDDELLRVEGHGRSAKEIGHLPVSGPAGSMAQLSALRGPRKIYIHINNTNPMLDEDGGEYRLVRERGWELAFDGMELSL